MEFEIWSETENEQLLNAAVKIRPFLGRPKFYFRNEFGAGIFSLAPFCANKISICAKFVNFLNKNELEALIAHEAFHSLCFCSLLRILLYALPGLCLGSSLVLVGGSLLENAKDTRILCFIGIGMSGVFCARTVFVRLVTRKFEIAADAFAAKVSGTQNMISMLRKLNSGSEVLEKFVTRSFWLSMFQTHPFLRDRI